MSVHQWRHYSVVVTNLYGLVPSSNALLTYWPLYAAASPSGLVGIGGSELNWLLYQAMSIDPAIVGSTAASPCKLTTYFAGAVGHASTDAGFRVAPICSSSIAVGGKLAHPATIPPDPKEKQRIQGPVQSTKALGLGTEP